MANRTDQVSTVIAQADVDGLVAALAGKASTSHTHAQSDVTGLVAALAALAPLASPALTGTPTAPTATNGTNTTQIATCAFVLANAPSPDLSNYVTLNGTQTVSGAKTFTSTVVVQQSGGVSGTDEAQISHNGSHAKIESKDGAVRLVAPNNGSGNYLEVYDHAGNFWLEIGGGSGNFRTRGGYTSFGADDFVLTATGRWIIRGSYDFRDPGGLSIDCGIARDSAGVVRISDGSTGRAALLAASINLGGATLLDILTATASLDFGSIAAAGIEDLTMTVTGAAVGDAVFLSRPDTEDAGLVTTGRVTAADTVTVRATNASANPIDQSSATYRAVVLKF